MEISGKVVVVTGAAKGIGFALAERFLAEGAAGVTVADLDPAACKAAVDRLGPRALDVAADVSDVEDIRRVVSRTEEAFGPIDLFCCNAGVATAMGVDAPDEVWERAWQVNVMAHARAAQVVLPAMIERGQGYLLVTASAAGLLSNIGDAPYTATKHAAVGLAEWLSITYGDRGIKVSCLCPQGVRTDMLTGGRGSAAGESVILQGVLEPAEVAAAVVDGLREERFLILPHPEVAEYQRRKVDHPDRWLAGMRRLQARMLDGGGGG